MSEELSKSKARADAYVGSLISLTSTSEIRYEGILHSLNTDDSSITLSYVRSFGTEGRKKDGPQVLPDEKVYGCIEFRGSNIKDLQVKSTPDVQTPTQTTAINSDPAIVQSHYLRPSLTPPSLPPPITGSSTDSLSHTAPPGSTYQGAMPLYQPGGNLGLLGPPPPHSIANNSGPGYYTPPNGPPQLHQQSLLWPPTGLAMPPSMQYPIFIPSFPTGTSSLSGSSRPQFPSPLLLTTTSPLSATNTSLPSSLFPPASLPSFMQSKAPNAAIPAAPLGTSNSDMNTIVSLLKKPMVSSSSQYSTTSQPFPSVGISTSVQTYTAAPSLITPGQLLQSCKGNVSSDPSSQIAHKDAEVVQVSRQTLPKLPVPVATEAQPPILPLPQQSRAVYKPNGCPQQARYNNYRGHERGRGSGSSGGGVMKFTEEFDFVAMNEKFNKDELWGYFGRSKNSNSKEKEGDENATEEDAESHKSEVKPVYKKDDFFDALSYNTRENQSNNERPGFSEQTKSDTETFGGYTRHQGGRGGRYRGGYNGRGYGYAGRGRGCNMPQRDH
ncbi:hypothetical protein ACET3Z_031965 [Daucus carota]